MSTPSENLERLISRVLDDEADAGERRTLKLALRRDPGAAAEFDDLATLDREVRYAIRRRFGRPLGSARPLPLWGRVARAAGLAAAACVAAALWMNWPQAGESTAGPARAALEGTLFAPPPAAQDTLVDGAGFDRPQVQTGDSERQWILIPTENPTEFLLIEVNQGQRRTIRIQADF